METGKRCWLELAAKLFLSSLLFSPFLFLFGGRSGARLPRQASAPAKKKQLYNANPKLYYCNPKLYAGKQFLQLQPDYTASSKLFTHTNAMGTCWTPPLQTRPKTRPTQTRHFHAKPNCCQTSTRKPQRPKAVRPQLDHTSARPQLDDHSRPDITRPFNQKLSDHNYKPKDEPYHQRKTTDKYTTSRRRPYISHTTIMRPQRPTTPIPQRHRTPDTPPATPHTPHTTSPAVL